jgi:hypothetical protein
MVMQIIMRFINNGNADHAVHRDQKGRTIVMVATTEEAPRTHERV